MEAEKETPEKQPEAAAEPTADAQSVSSGSIVVIDDDFKQNMDEPKPETEKAEVKPEISSVIKKPKTPLEELTELLHDKEPLSSAQLSQLFVMMDDFRKALKCVQPSAKREGFATVPDVTWDDVGSLQDIREELKISILVGGF